MTRPVRGSIFGNPEPEHTICTNIVLLLYFRYMKTLSRVPFIIFLLGACFLPSTSVSAAGWATNPSLPTDGALACIEGTTGTTGLITAGTGYGGGDSWAWTSISGDEDNFSLTLDYIEGGNPFDTALYYQFFVAFRQPGELCTTNFNPNWYNPTVPPAGRFNPVSDCTPTLTSSTGSSVGTLSFEEVTFGGFFSQHEFQQLTLSLQPQTASGTFTYTISFACGTSEDSESAGGNWEFDLNHYLMKAESSLPDTL